MNSLLITPARDPIHQLPAVESLSPQRHRPNDVRRMAIIGIGYIGLVKTVGVLGLAFKPNTTDVCEAPAINLIDLFVSSGATVTAHGPIAIEGAR
jgi:UDPglucose 6-dehydrogenase